MRLILHIKCCIARDITADVDAHDDHGPLPVGRSGGTSRSSDDDR